MLICKGYHMTYMTAFSDWFVKRVAEIEELPGLPISTQLRAYDDAGTGIGFILILEMLTTSQEEKPQITHRQVLSVPVVKVRGIWMTTSDENLTDIFAGVVRLAAPINEGADDSGSK